MEFRGKKFVLRNRTSLDTCRGRGAGELCTNIVKYTLKLGKVYETAAK
jgi:hypothetical protein